MVEPSSLTPMQPHAYADGLIVTWTSTGTLEVAFPSPVQLSKASIMATSGFELIPVKSDGSPEHPVLLNSNEDDLMITTLPSIVVTQIVVKKTDGSVASPSEISSVFFSACPVGKPLPP